MRPRVRLAATLLAATCLPGCDAMLGPDEGPAVYVMTTIGAESAPSVNVLQYYGMAEGYGWYVLADTLILRPDGTGERRCTYRSFHPADAAEYPEGRDVGYSARLRHVEFEGRTWLRYVESCSTFCFAQDAERVLDPGRDGSLWRDWAPARIRYQRVE